MLLKKGMPVVLSLGILAPAILSPFTAVEASAHDSASNHHENHNHDLEQGISNELEGISNKGELELEGQTYTYILTKEGNTSTATVTNEDQTQSDTVSYNSVTGKTIVNGSENFTEEDLMVPNNKLGLTNNVQSLNMGENITPFAYVPDPVGSAWSYLNTKETSFNGMMAPSLFLSWMLVFISNQNQGNKWLANAAAIATTISAFSAANLTLRFKLVNYYRDYTDHGKNKCRHYLHTLYVYKGTSKTAIGVFELHTY